MKLTRPAKAVLSVVAIMISVISPAIAQQPAISIAGNSTTGKSRTVLGGQLQVAFDFQAFENNSFSCTPVQPLKKGDVVAAMVSDDQAWSADTAGDRQRRQDEKGYATKGRTSSRDMTAMLSKYPVVSMVKTSDGTFHSLYPGILKSKTDIKAVNVFHSDGYQIAAERPVKAGEAISVLVVGDGILSIEGTVDGSKPWFAAFKDDMKPSDRASAIQAWRTGKEHVGK
jgi:hypothetical protein